MPRSVRLAIVAACCLGLVNLVHAGLALAELARDDVPRVGSALLLLIWPVLAIWIARGLMKRDSRTRTLAFRIALAGAVIIGMETLVLGIVATFIEGRDVGVLTARVLIERVGPFVALAWSLSRPSAKAWVSTPPTRDGFNRPYSPVVQGPE